MAAIDVAALEARIAALERRLAAAGIAEDGGEESDGRAEAAPATPPAASPPVIVHDDRDFSKPQRSPSGRDANAAIAAARLTNGGVTPPASQPRAALPVVYVGMAADIVHHGHVNIIRVARMYGKVVIGLLTDEAILSYKRKTVVPWNLRKIVVENFVGVDLVIPQNTLDYRPNLRALQPKFVVHGDDWKNGKQAKTRQNVIDCLAEWGGQLIEPVYTSSVSTTELLHRCADRVNKSPPRKAAEPAAAGGGGN